MLPEDPNTSARFWSRMWAAYRTQLSKKDSNAKAVPVLSIMADDPLLNLRRHPMEGERAVLYLDPRNPEKSIGWIEEGLMHCEQFWSEELDQHLVTSIERHGVFWPKPFWREIKHIVRRVVSSHPLGEDALDPDNRWLGREWEGKRRRLSKSTIWASIGWIFQRYGCSRASQLPGAMTAYSQRLAEQSRYHRCLLCGWRFRPRDLPDYLYIEGEGCADFCHTCLMTAFSGGAQGHRIAKLPARKREMGSVLFRLVELMEFVPPHDFNGIATLCRVERARRPEVILQVWSMRSPDEYKNKFGSWLQALIAAGILSDDCRPTGRGTQCLAQDGHPCLSLAEKQIDDWLYQAGIAHTIEPFYPYHPKLNPAERRRADWEVRGTFVEYWGLAGDREYDRRMRAKRRLAKETGKVLIELYPTDLNDLSQKLDCLREGNRT
jgi:hypothetical protein